MIDRLTAALSERYRVLRELGAGGMATVWLAEDLRHERRVAIKVLKPELAAVIGAERFVVEIKTTAQLQHPHILPLFDSGETEGFLWFVMPYLEGESLREKLDREKQLGVEAAVRLAAQVADALDYAHRHGVIHWLAYVSNESGRNEIFVRPFPDVEAGKWQVSDRGGTEPVWGRTGSELFYRARDSGNLVAARYVTEPSFGVVERTELFDGTPYVADETHASYDVDLDDSRFLLARRLGNRGSLVFARGWFQQLLERVGEGGSSAR